MATEKKLPESRIKAIRETLERERAQLLIQVNDLDTEADIRQWRDAGSDDDPADTGSAHFERERAQSLANLSRRVLTHIDDAVARIEAGTYGYCERCGDPIELERLEALPHTTFCFDDKQREEHGR